MTFQPALSFDFKDHFAFTGFCDIPDHFVEQALVRGLDYVDQDWISQGDFQFGQMLAAAHLLTLAGQGGGAEASLAGEGLLGFSTIKSGGLSVTRESSGGKAGANAETELSLTTYGQRYLELLRRNKAGPRIASS